MCIAHIRATWERVARLTRHAWTAQHFSMHAKRAAIVRMRDGHERSLTPQPARPRVERAGRPRRRAGRIGVLLVNLGTPDGADAAAVRRYLREFLSDRRVIENQGPLWKLVLNGVILPHQAAAQGARLPQDLEPREQRIPLKTITRSQAEKLAAALEPLGHADRGRLGDALRQSVDRVAARAPGGAGLRASPGHPALSAILRRDHRDRLRRSVPRRLRGMRHQPSLRIAPPYYNDPVYIEAVASSTSAELSRLEFEPDVILASFHGVPKDFVDKGDPYCAHCMETMRLLRAAARSRRVEAAADVPVAFRPRRMARARDRPDRRGAGPGRRARTWR